MSHRPEQVLIYHISDVANLPGILAEMDAFARTVEAVLGALKYPSPGRVIFSEGIGGHSRASHGKGVRALTCAAFILGIMKHRRTKELPHP